MYYSTSSKFARALCALLMLTSIACSDGTPVAPESIAGGSVDAAGAAADGSTLKANAPTVISPINDEALASLRPQLVIVGSTGKFAASSFEYEFEVQTPAGATVARMTDDGTSTFVNVDLQRNTSYRWRARAIAGNAFGPWSNFGLFRTISIPGCINGLLLDPAAYFFFVINRKPGDRARDWFEVMANSGIPPGPPPGVDPGPEHYGMTQQTGNSGPRGRVFLPALDSDALGYRVSAWDILENSPAGLVWTFKYFDGGGYAPRACP